MEYSVQANNVPSDTLVEVVSLLSKETEADVWAKSDRWVVSAKSILGLMALSHEGLPITFSSTDESVINKIKEILGL